MTIILFHILYYLKEFSHHLSKLTTKNGFLFIYTNKQKKNLLKILQLFYEYLKKKKSIYFVKGLKE